MKMLLLSFCLISLTACVKPLTDGHRDNERAALINVELGLGYLSQGQVARAKTKLTHALELAPKLSETQAAMAYFLEMVGDFPESERAYKNALSVRAKRGAAYNNYGAFLCRRERYTEADRAFITALEDKGYARTAEVYENAGLCALKAKEPGKALAYLETAVLRDPHRTTARMALMNLRNRNHDSKN